MEEEELKKELEEYKQQQYHLPKLDLSRSTLLTAPRSLEDLKNCVINDTTTDFNILMTNFHLLSLKLSKQSETIEVQRTEIKELKAKVENLTKEYIDWVRLFEFFKIDGVDIDDIDKEGNLNVDTWILSHLKEQFVTPEYLSNYLNINSDDIKDKVLDVGSWVARHNLEHQEKQEEETKLMEAEAEIAEAETKGDDEAFEKFKIEEMDVLSETMAKHIIADDFKKLNRNSVYRFGLLQRMAGLKESAKQRRMNWLMNKVVTLFGTAKPFKKGVFDLMDYNYLKQHTQDDNFYSLIKERVEKLLNSSPPQDT